MIYQNMKIFLDLDGVLVNFNKAATAIVEVKYPPKEWWWFRSNEEFEKVNKGCTIEFWQNLEWMPDGKEILEIIERYITPKNIYLLTTPMPNPESATGKLLWIKRELPQYYYHTILLYPPKDLLVKPNHLLIDDKNENVDGFMKAGGQAILIPRLWNKNKNLNPISVLKTAFGTI